MLTLIKNVLILDGTGRDAVSGDILLRGDRILALGVFSRSRADQVIDGRGAYCAPGFIDISTRMDRFLTLFQNPEQFWFLRQGITTIVGGECGISLAPLFYDALRLLEEKNMARSFNLDWRRMKEFFNAMQRRRFGVHIGTFAGHATLRRAITDEDLRPLTAGERRVLVECARRALAEGAVGLSFGAGYSSLHPIGEEEMMPLLALSRKSGTLISLHTPEEGGKKTAFVRDAYRLSHKTGAAILLNHVSALWGKDGKEENPWEAPPEYPDASLYVALRLTGSRTVSVLDLLPLWMRDDPERPALREKSAVLRHLENPASCARALKELPRISGSRISIQRIPGHPLRRGTTLLDFSRTIRRTQNETLLYLAKVSAGEALLCVPDPRGERLKFLLAKGHVLLSSHATGFEDHKELPFEEYVKHIRQDKEDLARAIHAMTALPARLLGLAHRGMIRQGFIADLVLFREHGITDVVVAGEHALKDGTPQGILAGRILRRG